MKSRERGVGRRSYLKAAGAAVVAGFAGCLGESYDGEPVNEFGYETTETAGVDVPLVPIEDALTWHRNEEALFADARSREAYEKARIAGAVHSPAREGKEENDPVERRDTDTRVVTYCGCPHHLSTLRGASLIDAGYKDTYAIDEGFDPWQQNGHPMAGESVEQIPAEYSIDGRTRAEHAGEYAWVWHDESGQREAAPIGSDGTFLLHIRFYDVNPDSRLRLAVPSGQRTGPLEAFVSGEIEV